MAQSQSSNEGLLYKGMYSCNGQGYVTSSGQSYYNDVMAGNYEMEIYENRLNWHVYQAFYKYTTNSGVRVYESDGFTEDKFYVSSNYSVYIMSTISTWMGTTTYRYNLKKGQSTYSPQSNNSSPYSNNSSNLDNSSTSSSSSSPQKRWRNVTRTENCPSCHGSGKCWTCNGKGYYNSPYGTGTVTCPNCSNGRCRKCGGSGTITKTEQVYE